MVAIDGRGVQSVEVGGRILAAMVEARQPLMLRDLAARADIAPAQAHAYLLSFRKIGMVEQDPATGRYLLGPFALQLGIARLRSFDPLRMAGAAAIELSADLGLMVALVVWGSYGPTVIQVQEGSAALNVNVRPGAIFSVTGTASGAVFAAYLPASVTDPIVERELAERTTVQRVGPPISKKALAATVAEVRRRGYATIESRPIPGVNALSAPIFDMNGQVQAVMTLIGPATVLSTAPDSPLLEPLLACARRVSSQLGYSPEPAAAAAADPPPEPERPRPGGARRKRGP